MILYFSGTGNSRYVALSLSKFIGEKAEFLPHLNPSDTQFVGDTLGIVCPVYSWGIPPLVLDFIHRLNRRFVDLAASRPIWFVLTCGDETAYAPEILQKSLRDAGLEAASGWSVIMPNDYVLLPGFDVDDKELELKKLEESADRIKEIASMIISGNYISDFNRGNLMWLKSRVIYPLFCRWGISPRKWHWTQECVGCGQCAGVCPVGNIDLVGNRPRWGDDCVSCTACYHICPTHAIEYGSMTINKRQYRTLLARKSKSLGTKD